MGSLALRGRLPVLVDSHTKLSRLSLRSFSVCHELKLDFFIPVVPLIKSLDVPCTIQTENGLHQWLIDTIFTFDQRDDFLFQFPGVFIKRYTTPKIFRFSDFKTVLSYTLYYVLILVFLFIDGSLSLL